MTVINIYWVWLLCLYDDYLICLADRVYLSSSRHSQTRETRIHFHFVTVAVLSSRVSKKMSNVNNNNNNTLIIFFPYGAFQG